MYTTIQKWGNSQAIRLPKVLLEMARLRENDRLEIRVQDGNLVLVPVRKHRTLAERIAGYTGEHLGREWETGRPVGKEVL